MIRANLIILFVLLAAVGRGGGEERKGISPDDLPSFGGQALKIVSPKPGETVVAGSRLPVRIEVEDGIEMKMVTVVYEGGGLFLNAPFRGEIPIPEDRVGEMTISALGTTMGGEMVTSASVSVEVTVGDAELDSIEIDQNWYVMTGPGSVRSMYIYGEYSDGVRRNITDYETEYEVTEGSGAVCVFEDGVLVAKAPGRASVEVRHGAFAKRANIEVRDGPQTPNSPHANLGKEYVGTAGEKLCFSAANSLDYDECLGEKLTDESFSWRFLTESGVVNGTGHEFCVTPKLPGSGMVYLTVTDAHGASSVDVQVVIIR